MKFIEKYIEKQKKKSVWAWFGDIVFALLIIGLLIPSTRTPIMVFIKKATMFSPSVSADENYGQLSEKDYLWQLKDEEGKVTNLGELKGKPVFINFWATWCPPCIAEMPEIMDLEKDYGDKIHFVLVSNENHNVTNKFLQEKNWGLNTYQPQSRTPELLSSNSIPLTLIINKEGRIVVRKTGSSNWNGDSVRELLDVLIKE
ncbi:MAG: redoxin family protein [Bacteroidales bacterium]|nr:redoxin family protein [Bacteroidales bacterium]